MKRLLMLLAIPLVLWGAYTTAHVLKYGYEESMATRVHFGGLHAVFVPDRNGQLYYASLGHYCPAAQWERAKAKGIVLPPAEQVRGRPYWACGIGSHLHSTIIGAKLHRSWAEFHYDPKMGYPASYTVPVPLCIDVPRPGERISTMTRWPARVDGRCYIADKLRRGARFTPKNRPHT